jgi:hypothetical protein
MTAGRERQFGDAQLVLSIDLLEEALERRFEPDLRPLVSTFTGLTPTCARAVPACASNAMNGKAAIV